MRKNGFTLIELLAVIVILAVIALISVPVVTNIIEKTKKEDFKNNAQELIESGKIYYLNHMLNTDKTAEFNYNDGILSSGNETLNYIGENPKYGIMIISNKGDIAIAIHNGKWCATKKENQTEVKIEEKDVSSCNLEKK